MTTKRRRPSKAAPLAICLLALVILAVLILLLVQLFSGPAQPDAPLGPTALAVELSEEWENWFLTAHTTQEQKDYIDQTLKGIQAQGADLVLFTGRAGGGSLFRTKDRSLTTLETIRANDKFLRKKADPARYLLDRAAKLGMGVGLLATDDAGNPLTTDQLDKINSAAAAFAKSQGLPVFAPTPQPLDEQGRVTAWKAGTTTLLRCDGSPALLAAATMRHQGTGAVLGSWPALEADSTTALLYRRFLDSQPQEPLLEQPVAQTLAIAYPAADAVVYTDKVFLMGTSDPGQSLTINGAEVPRYGSRGVWGCLVDAAVGQNTFTAAQGGQEAQVTFTRRQSSWKPANPASDGSVPAKWGQKVRITSPLASLLRAPADPDSIAMTAYEGALAEVAQSLPLTLGSKKTYAYQLHSGHFVLAKDCELVDEPDAVFTGVTVEETPEGDQVLRLQGKGTPLYHHVWEGNVLTLTFSSASFTGQWPSGTGFVQSFEQSSVPTGFTVTMTFSEQDPLWGYYVDYVDGGTQIYLKRAPKLSDADTGPLTGVTVLLDPGHGEDDTGAMGCAGPTAPQEKDVNLALGKAAQHRLEQLGATVVMSRSDDTFYTLGQRVQQLNTLKPDFFISLHHNSAALHQDLNGGGGVEAHWFYTEGKPLAQNLVQAMADATGREVRGVFYSYFYVTRSNICPAVLLETGFMTVPKEYEQVTDEETLWAEGGAVAQGVLQSIPH